MTNLAHLSAPAASRPGKRAFAWRWPVRMLAAGALLVSSLAQAAPDAWTSTSSSTWNSFLNWSAGVPTTTSNLTFTDNTTIQHAVALGGSRSVATIAFANGTGNSLFIFDNAGSTNVLTVSGGITNSDNHSQVFHNQIAVNATQTWSTASGGLTVDGVALTTGTLTLTGGNPFVFGNDGGNLVVSGGNRTLTNNATGYVTIGDIDLSDSNTGHRLTINGTGVSTVNGTISNGGTGTGTFRYTGTGSVTLAGNNTYTGTTTVSSGTVIAASNTALGTAAAGTTVSSGGTLALSAGISISDSITISGTGATGSVGALTSISGTNTVSGTVTLGANATIGATSGQTLNLNGAVAVGANNLTVGSATGSGNVNINGALTSTTAGDLIKNGTGTLTLGAANPSFLGVITVNAGILQTNISGAITSANDVTVAAAGGLNLNGFNQTVGAFTDNGNLNLGAGGLLTLTDVSALNGTLSGSGTIVLNAGSILTLGANFSNSNINFQLNGGTLLLNGSHDLFGSLIVSANSIIDFSGGAIADFSSVSFPGSSILTVNNWSNAVSYFYSNTSIGTQGNAPATQIVFTGFTPGDTRWNGYINGPDNFHQVTPVPEPSTYGAIFVGLSLLGYLLVQARRKKSAQLL